MGPYSRCFRVISRLNIYRFNRLLVNGLGRLVKTDCNVSNLMSDFALHGGEAIHQGRTFYEEPMIQIREDVSQYDLFRTDLRKYRFPFCTHVFFVRLYPPCVMSRVRV